MPGPATLFSTIGAVGAAASAAVYVTKAISFPDVQQQVSNQLYFILKSAILIFFSV